MFMNTDLKVLYCEFCEFFKNICGRLLLFLPLLETFVAFFETLGRGVFRTQLNIKAKMELLRKYLTAFVMMDVEKSRGVTRTPSNIYDGVFFKKNSYRRLVGNNFCKSFHRPGPKDSSRCHKDRLKHFV